MSRRTRRKENIEPELEQPISIDEALNANVEVSIFDKFTNIVTQYGSNLILRVYAIKSDTRSLGFIDEIVGDEIEVFLGSPELFLRDRYGSGVFRIMVVHNTSKKFISNLTISVSNLKNPSNPTPNIDVIGEVSKARKEGRQEFVELASFIKSSQPPPSNQPAFDMVEFFKLMLATQDKTREKEERMREREDKRLEEIKKTEIRLREKELEMIEKAYSNNADVTAHMKPFLDSMGVYGKMLSNSIGMVERALDFKERFNAPSAEHSFFERIVIGLGEKFINSNPQIFDQLTAMIPQMSPKGLNTPGTTNLPLANNPTTENKPLKEETHSQDTGKAQFNLDYVLSAILVKYLKRGVRGEDPVFCADNLIADLDDFVSEKLISEDQLNQVYNLLISDNLEAYIRNFFPDVVKYKAWLINFQSTIKEGLTDTEPQEEKPEVTKKITS